MVFFSSLVVANVLSKVQMEWMSGGNQVIITTSPLEKACSGDGGAAALDAMEHVAPHSGVQWTRNATCYTTYSTYTHMYTQSHGGLHDRYSVTLVVQRLQSRRGVHGCLLLLPRNTTSDRCSVIHNSQQPVVTGCFRDVVDLEALRRWMLKTQVKYYLALPPTHHVKRYLSQLCATPARSAICIAALGTWHIASSIVDITRKQATGMNAVASKSATHA